MAGFHPSEEQKQAIYSRGENLLVAAGAGSGKTTVLVERILRFVENGGDITRILALTFTNAAASDMKDKLDKAISGLASEHPENRHLREQLSLLPQAQISTIHSFCLELLRSNYYRLGINAGFRIGAENDIDILAADTLAACIEEAYEDETSGIKLLADCYGGKNDDSALPKLALDLYKFCLSRPDPFQWLNEACSVFSVNNLHDLPYGPKYHGLIRESMERIADILALAEEMFSVSPAPVAPRWLEIVRREICQLDRALAADTLDELLRGLYELDIQKLTGSISSKYADAEALREAKACANDAAKQTGKLKEKYCAAPPEIQLADINALAEPMSALYRLIEGFHRRFREEKQRHGWVDFSDMEHYALELLRDDEVSRQQSRLYDEILVDEYQDINEVQEAILQRLACGNNLFVVGDVKQSIYRFRLAEPQLFLEKYDAYGNADGGRRIDLNKNYRSEKPVIDAVNYIFRLLMKKKTAELDYDEAAQLNTDKAEEKYPPEFYLLDTVNSGLSAAEAEAELMARRIQELHAEGYAYGDMAILLRNLKRRSDIIISRLAQHGIPAAGESSGFLDSSEVGLILSALRAIDQPRQDIPLAAVLRSPLGNFDPDELVAVRFADKEGNMYQALKAKAAEEDPLAEKCRGFLYRLANWRRLAGERGVAELLLALYRENGYYQMVGAMSGGGRRQADLQLLLREAYDYEQKDYAGLFRFIHRIDKIIGQELKSSSPQLADERDCVHITTIHKSKGLEFPVVFVAGLAGKFNFRDESDSLIWDRQAGLGPQICIRQERRRIDTLCHKEVSAHKRQMSLAEEMRIYYVALTRAKERLILLAAGKDITKRLNAWSDPEALSDEKLLDAADPLCWLGAAVLRHPDAGNWRDVAGSDHIETFEAAGHWRTDIIDAAELEQADEDAPACRFGLPENASADPQIDSILSFRYPNEQYCDHPAKWSVSALMRNENESAEPACAVDEHIPDNEDEQKLSPGEVAAAQKRAAARGTAVHALLEHIDLKGAADKDSVADTVSRMKEKGLLDEEIADFISPSAVAYFLNSPLGTRLRAAETVARELPFTMQDTEIEERPVVIQGVIDAVFRDGDGWVLLDYKTGGRGKTEDEIRKHYSPQLSWYKKAAERLLKAPVKEVWLVMLDLRQVIAV